MNMIYARKIHMRQGCETSQDLLEIESIFLEGCERPGFYRKEEIHDFLLGEPGAVEVGIAPYPKVIPAVSTYGEKYVRSSPDAFWMDNLLALPRR
jgi:hypothetical protein